VTTAHVGELLANCEARIMKEDGSEEVTQGERGEIWIRAPNAMKGYWRNLEATKEILTEDGWVKTGDIAYVDEEGHFYIVDRKKASFWDLPPRAAGRVLTSPYRNSSRSEAVK
jgi:4-coumarate--CoA ligase